MYKTLKEIFSWINSYGAINLIALLGIICIYHSTLQAGIQTAFLLGCIPLILLVLCSLLKSPLLYLLFFFILNYFVMGFTRYYYFKAGMSMTILALGVLMVVLLQSLWTDQYWKRSMNLLTALWGIWFVYCLLELANPLALFEPWSIAFTTYALYPLLFAILVPVLFKRYRNFEWLMIIWASLTLLAAAKGYWQKNRGFDPAELRWLYAGGASTHLIHTGIRYFSFFTDAANFGSSMGLSMVVFGISGFYQKKIFLKIFYWITAIAGTYGMLISGTRSCMAIPVVGLAVFLLLCRNIKAVFLSGIVLLGIFLFFNNTTIGNDNRLIRRMRTAFDKEDASLLVRTYNKRKIWNYMKDKPFGVGLGLGGGKAKRFRPNDPISKIPTDSHLVMTWVETGIVGLTLYLSVLLLLLYKATYIATKEIRNQKLKGTLLAVIAGITGIIVSSYANEVLSYPNGVIIMILFGLIYVSPYYDKELQKDATGI